MDRLGGVPGWSTADGYPTSWAHFVIGLSRLSQSDMRQQLRWYDAARMAQVVEKEARQRWVNDVLRSAGL